MSDTDDVCHCGLGIEDHKLGGAAEHSFVPMKCSSDVPSDTERDWKGCKVPKPAPNDIVTVWEVDPHPNGSTQVLVFRAWQYINAYVAGNLAGWLERFDEEELREGVTLTFRLVDMQAEDIPCAD